MDWDIAFVGDSPGWGYAWSGQESSGGMQGIRPDCCGSPSGGLQGLPQGSILPLFLPSFSVLLHSIPASSCLRHCPCVPSLTPSPPPATDLLTSSTLAVCSFCCGRASSECCGVLLLPTTSMVRLLWCGDVAWWWAAAAVQGTLREAQCASAGSQKSLAKIRFHLALVPLFPYSPHKYLLRLTLLFGTFRTSVTPIS